MTTKAGRGSDQFMLRLPDGMRDRIKISAEAANRSMNAEIVATLEEKYPAPVRQIGGGRALKLLADVERLMRAHEVATTQSEREALQNSYDTAMAELREFAASRSSKGDGSA